MPERLVTGIEMVSEANHRRPVPLSRASRAERGSKSLPLRVGLPPPGGFRKVRYHSVG